MIIRPAQAIDEQLVLTARLRAARGLYSGRQHPRDRAYLEHCTHFDPVTGTSIIYTRDADPHRDGWWKNPDYARNRHLSLGYRVPAAPNIPRPHDRRLTALWLAAFFADDRRWLWSEPPFSRHGKQLDIWHFRLFCDEGWSPIKPRGEVYSRDNTPAGWKSWSEVRELGFGDPIPEELEAAG
jgi:hypothetical protein